MTNKQTLDAEFISSNSTSYFVSLRIRHEDADEYSYRSKQLIDRIIKSSGFESVDVIRREGGLGVDFYMLARFNSQENLENWKNSPEHSITLGPIEELAIADISRQQASGSNILFEPVKGLPTTPKPPLFWKRWVMSLLAVYPALVILINLLQPITSTLPEPVGVLVVATILTGLTTSLIVPWLSKFLQTWLARH